MPKLEVDYFEEFRRLNDLLDKLDHDRPIIVVHPDKLEKKISVQGHEFTLRELFNAGHFKIIESTQLTDSNTMFLLDPTKTGL
jgi:hypothetical protein